jgi:hypothetical protein
MWGNLIEMKFKIFSFGKLISILSVLAFASACESPSQTDLNNIVGVSPVTPTSTTTSNAGPPHTIQIYSGNAQIAVNGTQLSNPLTAKVVDSSGNAVAGVSVTFAVVSGGGSIVTTQPVVTDAGGQASATVLLGAVIGFQTFSATMPSGTVTSVNFTETATALSTSLRIYQKTGADCLTGAVAVGATPLAVGDVFNLCAVIVNTSNLIVAEVPATWWTTGTLSPSNLSFPGGNPGTYASFSPSLVSTGTINALVTDPTIIAANNITATTAATGQIINSLPLTPHSISIVSGNSQTGQVGTNLSTPLKVRVTNISAVAVPGVNVTFAVASGGGAIFTSNTVTTDSNGYAEATVQLGGLVGTGHSFTATMPTGTTTQVLFTATATFGPPAALSFLQQPAGANSATSFSTQPIIEIRDSYGNRVTSATNTITLSKATGSGTFGGTLSLSAVSGLATFTNVSYDTAESGVSITAAATGLTSATSSTFTVGAIALAAQCQANGAGWNTIDGGCKDLTSGLVWSAISASTMNWHNSVWDVTTSGSSAAEPWEVARGLTRDWSAASNYDISAGAYCHDLTESGLTDWRMPAITEMINSYTSGANTALKNAANNLWSATVNTSTSSGQYTFSTGIYTSGQPMVNLAYVRCVRQPAPTQLLVTQQISGGANGLGANVPFLNQPVIRIADSTNSTTSYSTATVTLTVTTGTGLLCNTNTTTGVTSSCATTKSVAAVNGIATFSGISYSKAEAGVVITASTPGLTSVALNAFTVPAVYPLAACQNVGGVFVNGNGGCKDATTGTIYSSTSVSLMTWANAVWDSNVPLSSPPDSDDWRANEYYMGAYDPGASVDTLSPAYCHDLKESGYTDWYLPIAGAELNTLSGKSVSSYMYQFNSTRAYWAALTHAVTKTDAYIVNPFAGTTNWAGKGSSYWITCVRYDPPTKLVFQTEPGGLGYGFGAGVPFATQPVVDIQDASSAGPLYSVHTATGSTVPGQGSITLTVIPAADGTGGTGNLIQYSTAILANPEQATILSEGSSVSTNIALGRATFANLAYSKAGEKFRLEASATITWKGVPITITVARTADITMPAIYSRSQCNAQAGWASQYGGCMDQGASGLVWSGYQTTATWYDTVWDSTVPGSGAVDADDGANTSDYDATSPSKNDNSNYDVCHRLRLNGYSDWRLPTLAEVNLALRGGSRNGYTAVKNLTSYVWTSYGRSATVADTILATTGVMSTTTLKNQAAYQVVCVRPATP